MKYQNYIKCNNQTSGDEDFWPRCTYFQHTRLSEDGCVLQLKHVSGIKPPVQLVGNKLVCMQHGVCCSLSLKPTCVVWQSSVSIPLCTMQCRNIFGLRPRNCFVEPYTSGKTSVRGVPRDPTGTFREADDAPHPVAQYTSLSGRKSAVGYNLCVVIV